MEYISKESIVVLKSDFQDSYQLLWNENSSSKRVTITKVYVHPGKTNNRHSHDTSEQIWVALSGTGVLLLENEKTKVFQKAMSFDLQKEKFTASPIKPIMNLSIFPSPLPALIFDMPMNLRKIFNFHFPFFTSKNGRKISPVFFYYTTSQVLSR